MLLVQPLKRALVHYQLSVRHPCILVSGDGGNRTHVRGRVMDSFYERSQCSVSRPQVAALTGLLGTSLLRCPGKRRRRSLPVSSIS